MMLKYNNCFVPKSIATLFTKNNIHTHFILCRPASMQMLKYYTQVTLACNYNCSIAACVYSYII